jgi:hypothetical protein
MGSLMAGWSSNPLTAESGKKIHSPFVMRNDHVVHDV